MEKIKWINKIISNIRQERGKKSNSESSTVINSKSNTLGNISVNNQHRLDFLRSCLFHSSFRAHSKRHPNIKIANISTFSDAYCILLRICDQKKLKYCYRYGHSSYQASLPGVNGYVELTDNIGNRRDGTVAILKIDIPLLSETIKEIRFKLINPHNI